MSLKSDHEKRRKAAFEGGGEFPGQLIQTKSPFIRYMVMMLSDREILKSMKEPRVL